MNVTVMLCCRDVDGNLTGDCDGIDVYDVDQTCLISLESPVGEHVLLRIASKFILGTEQYHWRKHSEHVGNMLWDAVQMEEDEAKRLVRHCLSDGWMIEEQVVGWLEGDKPEEYESPFYCPHCALLDRLRAEGIAGIR